MSLFCYVAALVVGVGGFDVPALPTAAMGDSGPADMLRLAYPQRSPAYFQPAETPIDDLLPKLERRTAVVREQNWEAAQAARAQRSLASKVRSRPLPLSTLPALAPGSRVQVTISFYYCSPGPSGRVVGDGGRFCGKMRNGERVHSGAAACAARYLGQRFRIEGDPTGRIYTCKDTGSAVHGQHRDIWFRTADGGRQWVGVMGRTAIIEIVP